VLAAVQQVFGSGVVATVASALDMHSPSRVMAQLGAHTAEGFRLGVDAGTPRVQMSMDALVAAPGLGARERGGGGATVSGTNVTIQVYTNGANGPEVADAIGAVIPDALAEAFAQLLAQRPATSG
jgi:hypothetical protein